MKFLNKKLIVIFFIGAVIIVQASNEDSEFAVLQNK